MVFRTAIAAAALSATMLPTSAMLVDIGAGAADLQQIRRVSKPSVRVYIERRTYVARRYYPSYTNPDAYDAYFQYQYWKVLAESPYRPRPWYLK
jgi:hypothetical protein